MELLDVAVIGAGPAGSSAAYRLSAYGLKTAVFDKAHFPRDKCCAGWLTPGVFERLGIDPTEYGRRRTLQRIHGLVVWDDRPRKFAIPAGWGIRRQEFDAFLVDRLGVKFFRGYPIKRLNRHNGMVEINGEFVARLVIGAGGHLCPVAMQLGSATKGDEWTIAALCTEGRIPAKSADRMKQWAGWPHIIFAPDFSGYGWFFVKNDFVNIGMGVAGGCGARVRSYLDWMLDLLEKQGVMERDLLDFLPGFHGHFYKIYSKQPRRLIGDNFMLVGDAAGLASPFSGEGIGPAVISGQLAAEVAVAGLYGNRVKARDLAVYRDLIQAELGTLDTGFAGRMLEILIGFTGKSLMRSILSSTELTRRIIVENWFSAFG